MENTLTPEEIKQKLDYHCMSQNYLAGKIMITPTSLSAYMQGKASPNTKTGRRAYQFFKRIESWQE